MGRFLHLGLLLALIFATSVGAFYTSVLTKGSFFEDFRGLKLKGWVPAASEKIFKHVEDVKYAGRFKVDDIAPLGLDPDYAIFTEFPHSLSGITKLVYPPVKYSKQTGLVIQYEAKFPKEMECGGGYIKFLSYDGAITDARLANDFDDDENQVIIFGPDSCLLKSRTHYFLSFEKKAGEHTKTQLSENLEIGDFEGDYNIYTLVLTPEGGFRIKINNNIVMDDDYTKFYPPIYTPKKIKNPSVKDPNEEYKYFIIDENEQKPDDWDDTQAELIPDESAVKPEGWRDDIEPFVQADEEGQKFMKDHWLPEFLGEYTPRLIPNQPCVSGKCGKWKPPMISNPNYKGEWSPQYIPNPEPPITWEHPLIDNPNYVENINPNEFLRQINAISIDIWATHAGVSFKNIYLGNSESDADLIAQEFLKKRYQNNQLSGENVAQVNNPFLNILPSNMRIMAEETLESLNYYRSNPIEIKYKVIEVVRNIRDSGPLTLIFTLSLATAGLIMFFSKAFYRPTATPPPRAKKEDASGKATTPDEQGEVSSEDNLDVPSHRERKKKN